MKETHEKLLLHIKGVHTVLKALELMRQIEASLS
jgi:hypothetical protein